MGGGDTKIPVTDAEKSAALDAQARWNERKSDGYIDLEKQAISDADRDYTSLLSGQASADVARSERDAYANLQGAPSARRLGAVSSAVGTANTLARNDASAQGLRIMDTNRINAIKRGNDVATDSSQLLGTAADLSSRRATDVVQNRIMAENARMQGAIQLAGAAIQGNTMKDAGYSFNLKQGLVDKKGTSKGYLPLLANLR
jgi:hypothetical protein